jgi:hypothetical protein
MMLTRGDGSSCGGVICRTEAQPPSPGDWRGELTASLDDSLRTEHFLIHYTTHGEDSIGAAYRDSLALYLEIAYERFAWGADFGMRTPRGEDDAGDPQSPIHCHVEYIDWALGYVYLGPAIPDACVDSRSGGIVVGNRLHPSGLRNTSAHELFHLFERRESDTQGAWLGESSANWAANRLWPDDIEYVYSHDFSFEPFLPLWEPGFRWRIYGAAVFWDFLDAVFDETIAPKVWARCCSTDWYSALTEEASAHGADLDSLLVEFAKWNNATGTAADDRHYWNGELLSPMKVQASHDNYPIESASLPDSLLAREAASDYVLFMGRANRERLHVTFAGDPGLADRRRVSFIATTRPNTHTEWTLAPDTEGRVTFVLDHWNLYDWVKMIVSNYASVQGIDSAGWRFTYSAEEIGASAFDVAWPASDELLRVAPNPLSWAASIRFRVDDPGRPTRVTIYDVTGRAVRRLANGTLGRGDHTVIWDGMGDGGRQAGSGVYLLEVENGVRMRKRLVLLK